MDIQALLPLVSLVLGCGMGAFEKFSGSEGELEKRISFIQKSFNDQKAVRYMSLFDRFKSISETDDTLHALRGDGIGAQDVFLDCAKMDIRFSSINIKMEILLKVIRGCFVSIFMTVAASLLYIVFALKFSALVPWAWPFIVVVVVFQIALYGLVRVSRGKIKSYENQI
ncbi:hypothetical protein [Alloalcanivorax xenomutans]|uniref:hypothetical protein n=1 Tax=Alloalcanivorax xenomutans TaxID=1094342 RepID=UPI0024E25B80|nr:hypothetical protein [Alloalcanivorax xenomutans]